MVVLMIIIIMVTINDNNDMVFGTKKYDHDHDYDKKKRNSNEFFFLRLLMVSRYIDIRMNERFDYCLFSFDQTNQLFQDHLPLYFSQKNGVGIEYFLFSINKKKEKG